MKKIFFLSDGGNPHTIKWVISLAKSGHKIYLFSLTKFDPDLYKDFDNIDFYVPDVDQKKRNVSIGAWSKLKYLACYFTLRSKLLDFGPDIVHAHFATSYGLLGSLLFFRPFFISVWGADVYDFPEKGPLHRILLKFNLFCATRIFSTSHVMARQTEKFTSKPIQVIPFGLSTDVFTPKAKIEDGSITIGTVKTLEEKYGIRYLVEAFSILKKKRNDLSLKLLIVGKGSQHKMLLDLAHQYKIQDETTFTGWVPVQKVAEYHNMIDIAVFPSVLDSESFGVAVIEASACEKPVVVSNKGGLVEVVEDGVTGIVVESQNPQAIASALEKLINDENLRKEMGRKGRARVQRLYEWKNNLRAMLNIYDEY